MNTRPRVRPRFWHSIASVAALVVVANTETASADCNSQRPIRAVSASKFFELKADFGRKNPFSIAHNGEIIASDNLDISGHHLTGYIDDTGARFILHDKYEGLTIYNGAGQVLRRFTPRQLLSFREQRTRPGKWACHAEGYWSSESNPLHFGPDGTSVILFTHAGREIVIDLASARVVQEEPDLVQQTIVLTVLLPLLGGGMLAFWWLWRCAKRTNPCQNVPGADTAQRCV